MAYTITSLPIEELTPSDAYKAFELQGHTRILLDFRSEEGTHPNYTIVAAHPYQTFQRDAKNSEGEKDFDNLRAFIEGVSLKLPRELPGFLSGAYGFLSYEAAQLIEPFGSRHMTEFPYMYFCSFATVLFFDHSKNLIHILQMEGEEKDHDINKQLKIVSKPFVDDVQFGSLVEKAKVSLACGDAFQIVISRAFNVECHLDPIDLYNKLVKRAPTPYMYVIECPHGTFVGASPEKLVSVRDRVVETMPIAGTKRRTLHGGEEQELLGDPKELAEHAMLVDLGRNDLGKIAVASSVHVAEYRLLKRFSHVVHLVSKIQALLAPEFDAVDALKAVFPAGTLTGAPKRRAMEIIDALEGASRCLYGGAICAFNCRGDLESIIAIRTLHIFDQSAEIRAGAGVVMDSDPKSEAQETRNKAAAILEIFEEVR